MGLLVHSARANAIPKDGNPHLVYAPTLESGLLTHSVDAILIPQVLMPAHNWTIVAIAQVLSTAFYGAGSSVVGSFVSPPALWCSCPD